MRHALIVSLALIAGFILLGPTPGNAAQGLAPARAAWDIAPGAMVKVDYWRRYYRRHGYDPVPDGPPPIIVEEAPAVLTEPRVMIVPVRPVSCGQYRYWDGETCVDARYHNPYLGPR